MIISTLWATDHSVIKSVALCVVYDLFIRHIVRLRVSIFIIYFSSSKVSTIPVSNDAEFVRPSNPHHAQHACCTGSRQTSREITFAFQSGSCLGLHRFQVVNVLTSLDLGYKPVASLWNANLFTDKPPFSAVHSIDRICSSLSNKRL